MDGLVFWIIFSQAVVSAFFCSFVAGEKGRDSFGWFISGFFFSLPALIAIAGCPSLQSYQPNTDVPQVYRSKDPELDRDLDRILDHE